MKKLLAALLVLSLLLVCAACGNETAVSSSDSSASVSETSAESGDASSEAVDESSAVSAESESADVSDEASGDVSADIGGESSEDQSESSEAVSEPEDASSEDEQPSEPPAFGANYISYGKIDTSVRAESANSVRLTGVDVPLSYGSVVLYTYKTPKVDDLLDYAVARFEYNSDEFGYMLSEFSEPGVTGSERVPDDGFLVVAHKSQEEIVKKLRAFPKDKTVFPHGVQPCRNIAFTAKRSNGGINIDGNFSEEEWKAYKIEDVNEKNPNWSYAQFDKGNYYSTGAYYSAYDDNYIYLCVVVHSYYHYCPITQDTAGNMWKYECIQVKVSSESPDSAYIAEHFDHVVDNTAHNTGVVRSYGFAVNDNGETCYYENAITKTFTGLVQCSRNDGAQLTVYEVAIPWAEFEITPKAGMKLGLSFSINSTNEDDVAKSVWKNITYRDGGGVIGRNDWSKIPVVTLG